MRLAIVEIAGEMLPDAVRILADAGFKFEGSLNHGFDQTAPDCVRLVLRDEAGTILPAQCEAGGGWWLVKPTFVQESYGKQTISRVGTVEVAGKLEFGVDGTSKLVTS